MAEINYDRTIGLSRFGHQPCDFQRRYSAVKHDNDRLTRLLGDQQRELDRRRWLIAALVQKAGGAVALTYLDQSDAYGLSLDVYMDGRDDTFNVRIGKPSDPVVGPEETP